MTGPGKKRAGKGWQRPFPEGEKNPVEGNSNCVFLPPPSVPPQVPSSHGNRIRISCQPQSTEWRSCRGQKREKSPRERRPPLFSQAAEKEGHSMEFNRSGTPHCSSVLPIPISGGRETQYACRIPRGNCRRSPGADGWVRCHAGRSSMWKMSGNQRLRRTPHGKGVREKAPLSSLTGRGIGGKYRCSAADTRTGRIRERECQRKEASVKSDDTVEAGRWQQQYRF